MLSNRYLPVFALGITLIMISASARLSQAVTINVPGDFATIQGAIDDPNTVAGDEIVVAPGTYNEIIDFLGKAITLRSSGGAGVTTIDGGAAGSVVTCSSGETATSVLDGFAITNGSATNGGGMLNNSSSPTVTNCTFSGNSATEDGGGMFTTNSSPTMTNCILWGNVDDDDASAGGPFTDESAQIHTLSGTPVVKYSDVQGGWTGAGGTGNINADPNFADADGADNVVGTGDDDLRLSAGSPCIDAGISMSFSPDLDGNPRMVDDPAITNTGFGSPPIDMGAYEFGSFPPPCNNGLEGDLNCDGIVDLLDLVLLAANFLETI